MFTKMVLSVKKIMLVQEVLISGVFFFNKKRSSCCLLNSMDHLVSDIVNGIDWLE